MNSMGGGYLSLFGLLYFVLNFFLELIDDLSRRNQVEDVYYFVVVEEDSSCINEFGVMFFFNILYFCDLWYDVYEVIVVVFEFGVVLRWWMKDRVRILFDLMVMIFVVCMNCFNEVYNNCE